MIYTSCFSNWRHFPRDSLICAVCRYPPNGEMIALKDLAPEDALLSRFKSKEIDEFIFAEEYKKQLEKLDKDKWIALMQQLNEQYGNVVLCCYEKKDDFCHRHILAKWFNININEL